MILRDLAATVGRTPMVELERFARGLPGRVVAKLEMRNPCGSVKDRLGVALIEDAERRGVLCVPGRRSTAYLVAQTIVTPLYGKLGDLYGRKRIL